MNKYDINTLDALRETGANSQEVVDAIHDFYEKEAQTAYNQGLKKGFLNLRWMLAIAAGLVIIPCSLWGVRNALISDKKTHERFMASCASGDNIGCLEAVQDQLRQAKALDDIGGKNTGWSVKFYDRTDQLLLAYRLKTGHKLPSK